MQVDDDFRKRIKKIQENIMKKKGKFTSIPQITRSLTKLPEWEEMEKKLTEGIQSIEFRINFDRRKKQ